MRIVCTSYSKTHSVSDPRQWLQKIDFFTGLLSELARRHEVASIERINYVGELDHEGVHYYFVPQKNNISRFPRRMHNLISGIKPDIVLLNCCNFSLQAIQLRKKLGPSTKIIALHQAEKPLKGLKKYLQQWADSCIDAYMFASKDFAVDWKKNIDTRKVHEVQQLSSVFKPRDKKMSRKKLQLGTGKVFLWVGRLIPNKDPITVIKAFIEFQKQERDAVLCMIYQDEQLLDEVKMLSAGNPAIRLLGLVPHAALGDWFSAADFYLSGSHYEGGGTAVMEAMSCGCFPIVTDISSFRGITGYGKHGWLYPPGNVDALYELLLKTITFPEQERKSTIEYFEKELSFAAIARKIEAIVSSLPSKT